MPYRAGRQKGKDDQAELTRRVERLETWFILALFSVISILGGVVIAVLF